MSPHLYFILFITGIFGSYLNASSQTSEERVENQKTYHSNIQQHSLKIKYGESRNKKELVVHAEEIGKNLDSAVLNREELKILMKKKERHDFKQNNASIEKHHFAAKKHHTALVNELLKPKPNEMAVRHHASHVSSFIEKADKEGMAIEEKILK